MNCKELQTFLVRYMSLSTAPHANLAILLNSMEEVNVFSKGLNRYIDALPDWIQPSFKTRQIRNISTDTTRIYIVNNADWLRSKSLSILYKSSMLSEDKRKEYSEVEMIHTIINGPGKIFTFDNI